MTQAPIEWYDRDLHSRDRKIWTNQENRIPALRMIGYHNASHALSPLMEHFHPNCFEFTYVIRGNLHFSTEDTEYNLSGGDLFITRPGEIHSTGRVPMSLHQMYWFQLEADHPEHFLFLEEASARWLLRELNRLPRRVYHISSGGEESLRSIIAGISGGTEPGRLRAGILLADLLCQLLQEPRESQLEITPDIARATIYLEEHIREKIELQTLADAAILSLPQFKQKFKAQLGVSPRSYVNFHKIQLACTLLQQGRSVTDTAMTLGFSSSEYFAVVFRRYTTFSPTEYIQQKHSSAPDPEETAP